jgi:hypothetical protein
MSGNVVNLVSMGFHDRQAFLDGKTMDLGMHETASSQFHDFTENSSSHTSSD